jgi:hypothetical protein
VVYSCCYLIHFSQFDFDRLILSLYWDRIVKTIDQGHPVYSGKKVKETTSGTERVTNQTGESSGSSNSSTCHKFSVSRCLVRLRHVSPFRGSSQTWSGVSSPPFTPLIHLKTIFLQPQDSKTQKKSPPFVTATLYTV